MQKSVDIALLVLKYLLILGLSTFLFYNMLQGAYSTENIPDLSESHVDPGSYLAWVKTAFKGELETENYHLPIHFFQSGLKSEKVVGSAFRETLSRVIAALLLSWFTAMGINILLLTVKNILKPAINFFAWILNFISGFHVLVYAFIFYIIYSTHLSPFVLILMIGFTSNIYYDFFSEQHEMLTQVLAKDYIMSARAFGDSVFKHILQPVIRLSISQFLGMLPTVITSTVLVEIIFQRTGLGSTLFESILAPGLDGLIPELNVLLYIAIILMVSVTIISLIKEMLLFMISIKR